MKPEPTRTKTDDDSRLRRIAQETPTSRTAHSQLAPFAPCRRPRHPRRLTHRPNPAQALPRRLLPPDSLPNALKTPPRLVLFRRERDADAPSHALEAHDPHLLARRLLCIAIFVPRALDNGGGKPPYAPCIVQEEADPTRRAGMGRAERAGRCSRSRIFGGGRRVRRRSGDLDHSVQDDEGEEEAEGDDEVCDAACYPCACGQATGNEEGGGGGRLARVVSRREGVETCCRSVDEGVLYSISCSCRALCGAGKLAFAEGGARFLLSPCVSTTKHHVLHDNKTEAIYTSTCTLSPRSPPQLAPERPRIGRLLLLALLRIHHVLPLASFPSPSVPPNHTLLLRAQQPLKQPLPPGVLTKPSPPTREPALHHPDVDVRWERGRAREERRGERSAGLGAHAVEDYEPEGRAREDVGRD